MRLNGAWDADWLLGASRIDACDLGCNAQSAHNLRVPNLNNRCWRNRWGNQAENIQDLHYQRYYKVITRMHLV